MEGIVKCIVKIMRRNEEIQGSTRYKERITVNLRVSSAHLLFDDDANICHCPISDVLLDFQCKLLSRCLSTDQVRTPEYLQQ